MTSRSLEIAEGAGEPDDWRWAKLLMRTYDLAIDPELADFLRDLLQEIDALANLPQDGSTPKRPTP